MPTLSLRDLAKRFGSFQAVDGVSLDVPAGSVFGLLGPNGAGKTTTIRMLMDIIGPDAGEVEVFGHPRTRADLDRIGYLPEERGLYRKMTVLDQLVFLGELHGRRRADLLPAIDRWLERLGLADRRKAKLEELSKGMQQKIQLVGTLLHEPELLVLDEPFSGLDPINQGLFKDAFAELSGQGRTILFSTHVLEQAEKLCDHIALIARGRVVLAGEIRAIKRELAGHSFRVVGDGDLSGLASVPGVEEAIVADGSARIVGAADVPPHELLRRLVAEPRCAIREFSSEEPSLEEIFVQAVHDAQ